MSPCFSFAFPGDRLSFHCPPVRLIHLYAPPIVPCLVVFHPPFLMASQHA
jgi:hypothetical protein